MEGIAELPKPPGRRTSLPPKRPGAFSEYDKVGKIGGRNTNWLRVIFSVVLVVVLLLFSSVGIVIWAAFNRSKAPTVTVQRLVIPNFVVDRDFAGDQAVISADFEFFLESRNENWMTESKLENLIMEANMRKFEAEMGQTTIDRISQGSGKSVMIQVRTHGESRVNNQALTKEELKLDISISGNVVFSLGPLQSTSYAFMVNCGGVSALSKDAPCSSKLYSDNKHVSSPERRPVPATTQMPPLPSLPPEMDLPTTELPSDSSTPESESPSPSPRSESSSESHWPASKAESSMESPSPAPRSESSSKSPSPESKAESSTESPSPTPRSESSSESPSPTPSSESSSPAPRSESSPESPSSTPRSESSSESPSPTPRSESSSDSPTPAPKSESSSKSPLSAPRSESSSESPSPTPRSESSSDSPTPAPKSESLSESSSPAPRSESSSESPSPTPRSESLSESPASAPRSESSSESPSPTPRSELSSDSPMSAPKSESSSESPSPMSRSESSSESPSPSTAPKESPSPAPASSSAHSPSATTAPSASKSRSNRAPTRHQAAVNITTTDNSVILDNGILAVTIAKPDGHVTGIKYNGVDNILDVVNPEDDRGYWDIVWAPPDSKRTKGKFDRLKCTSFRVIVDSDDQVEVSFSRNYDPDAKDSRVVPLDIDIRYIILRGESGLYSYGIFERKKWPGCKILNARLAFKLFRTKFRNMVVTDNRRRKMPLPEDRMKGRGKTQEYPEAVILVNPKDSEFKGELDDKYQYSDESHDIRVHGFYSTNPPMGFWQITPSYEFRTGGPSKQFLTSHVGPSVLAMFVSAHYSGENVIPKFKDGETWKKVFGPILMFLNKPEKGQNASWWLWEDAKMKMLEETTAWPYDFVASDDFPASNQRANISGRLLVHDRFVDSEKKIPANEAYVGLSNPGEAGSWQVECKGYQFWTTTDAKGHFVIENVRPGKYDLFGWVPGFIGDFKYNASINLTIGHSKDLGDIVYEPPRDGPTLWEIGKPERTAKEFYVPDPNPKYVNKLYVNHPEKFRQYGLWERYTELYPDEDLVYKVNGSDYRKDWFYAQVTRKTNGRYNGTTWQIRFNLSSVDQGVYKLRLAIAGTTNAVLQVRVNKPQPSEPIFTAGEMGSDNAIARHGIHGIYWLFNVDIKSSKLKEGANTIYLTQTKGRSPFQGIMYDYIRLEAPSSSSSK